MRIFTFALPCLCLLCFLSLCDNKGSTPSVTDQLTGKRWVLFKVELDLVGHSERSEWGEFEACHQDDIVHYLKNGTTVLDIGFDNCGGKEKPATGSWALRNDDKILVLTGSDGGSGEHEISFPDVNHMALTSTDTTCCFDTNGDGLGIREAGMW